MHRFLKILLLIIFLWALTLPWTFSYLSTITPLPGSEVARLVRPVLSKSSYPKQDKIIIGIVACGAKPLRDTIVLIKSIILSSVYYGVPSLELILFTDDEHLYEVDIKVAKLSRMAKGLKFRYEIHPVIFPARNHEEWKTLFKPCASQRLFLHAALPHINEILYLDVDTLVVGDLREIWSRFRQMGMEQAVGLVPEHEVSSIGWYNRFAQHPFYPPLGLNTGVMLMNLTRLRTSMNWEDTILESYKTYKDKIVYGDQDLINIVFHKRPDAVYLLPCPFNYRTDHCIYGLNCKAAEKPKGGGIQILHGNRNIFHNEKICPIFSMVYQHYDKFDLETEDFITNLVRPLRQAFKSIQMRKDKNDTTDCDNIGHLIFPEL